MSAYVISEVKIVDPSAADRYRELAAASIRRHGGHYIVRGTSPAAVEGEWDDDTLVVIAEFPDRARLETWSGSEDSAEALQIRQVALDRRLLFVDGVDVAPV